MIRAWHIPGYLGNASLFWFRKAADQGNAEAQNNIGALYAKGEGVAHEYAQALSWFHIAAAQAAHWRNSISVFFIKTAGASHKTMRRPTPGFAEPPIRAARTRKTVSAHFTQTARALRRTMRRPYSGFAKPPIRAAHLRNSISAYFTPTAGASRRTMGEPCPGIERLPIREIRTRWRP